MGLDDPVAVMLPGIEVTIYPVTVLPPFMAGAVKLTVAEVSPAVAVMPVGAPGTVIELVMELDGIMLFEAAEAGPVPMSLAAVTVKVYGIPLVSPGMLIGLAGPVAVSPRDDVTV